MSNALALLLLSTTLSPLSALADTTPTGDFAQPCFIVGLLNDDDPNQACLWQTQLARRNDIAECLVATGLPPNKVRNGLFGPFMLVHHIVVGDHNDMIIIVTNPTFSDAERQMAVCLLQREENRKGGFTAPEAPAQ